MSHAKLGRLAAIGILVGSSVGCSWFRGAPEAPARIADRMRLDPVPYEQLRASAAKAPQRNVLWLRETYLAELALGATTEAVRRRWGEPTRVRQAAAGTWWEYEETYPRPGWSPAPVASGAPPDERREPMAGRVGMNLRLLFVAPAGPTALPATPAPAAAALPAPAAAAIPAPTPDVGGTQIELVPAPEAGASAEPDDAAPAAPVVAPTPTPAPTKVLAHIQAWAPARFQTRSLVRVLDAASRVERKYGQAPQVLPWGREGGEVWLYPAANVGYVMTPAWEEQPRHVAGTLVGF